MNEPTVILLTFLLGSAISIIAASVVAFTFWIQERNRALAAEKAHADLASKLDELDEMAKELKGRNDAMLQDLQRAGNYIAQLKHQLQQQASHGAGFAGILGIVHKPGCPHAGGQQAEEEPPIHGMN